MDSQNMSPSCYLSLDFEDVVEVDFETLSFTFVKGNQSPLHQDGQKSDLSSFVYEYAERIVYPGDKEKFLASFDPKNCLALISEVPTFTLHYRIVKDDGIHFIKAKAVRKGDDSKKAIVGFGYEDSYVLSRSLSRLTGFGGNEQSLLVYDSHLVPVSSFLKQSFEVTPFELTQESFRQIEKDHNKYSAFLFFAPSLTEDIYRFIRHKSQCPLLNNLPVLCYLDSQTEEQVSLLSSFGAICAEPSSRSEEAIVRFARNIVLIQQEENKITSLERDELTGILTRQAFVTKAEHYLSSAKDEALDLILADIVDLKTINNVYGLSSGDAVIQYLAKCCYLTPGAIFVGRYEGDRICLLAHSNDRISLQTIEESKDRITLHAPLRNLHFRFGIVKSLPAGISLNEAINRGRLALSSLNGKTPIAAAVYSPTMQDDLFRELKFQEDFESGIENREFVLYYQPKYTAKTGELFGAEALVRWIKNGEILSPTEFIKVFERDERIIAMDRYVFSAVCAFQAKNIALGRKLFPISVNLSRNTLFQFPVAEVYSQIAKEYGVPLNLVPLEITETAAISSRDVKDFADALYQKGFVLDMDDFGAGYSSLYSMDILHFDVIKIDKSLIDLIGNPRAEITLTHVMDLAQDLGMTVIAEGVETREQFLFLRGSGCDVIQGFYFSLPLPENEFEALMEAYEPRKNALFELPFHRLRRSDVARILIDVDYPDEAVASLVGPIAFFEKREGEVRLTSANLTFVRLLSLDWNEGDPSIGDFSKIGCSEEDREQFASLFFQNGRSAAIRFQTPKKPIVLNVETHYLKNEGESEVYFALFRDVSSVYERADFLSNIPGGILYFSALGDGSIIYSNEYLWTALGFEGESDFLQRNEDFLSLCPEQGKEILSRLQKKEVPEGKTEEFDAFDLSLKSKSGEMKAFCASGRLLSSKAVGLCALLFLEEPWNR
ncbi:MAG: GGDEF domain-containing phosphodiesterase [Candidatus Enteromonas sp.]|nr:GGDEF domain-containing phosphodiesterase [Candidatus Enteromonas sp.]